MRDNMFDAEWELRGPVVAQLQGDYPAAKSRYEDSRGVREEIGDVAGVATTDGNLAILAEFDGDFPAALAINDRALALRRQSATWRTGIGEMNGLPPILNGDLESARRHLQEALRSRDRATATVASTFTLGNAERSRRPGGAAARYGDAPVPRARRPVLADSSPMTWRACPGRRGGKGSSCWAGPRRSGRDRIARPPTFEVELEGHLAWRGDDRRRRRGRRGGAGGPGLRG
jgi:hypothetical protein